MHHHNHFSMATKRPRVPGSLVQQCHDYILMHLEELPVSHLSLLPLSTRKTLLWQLPIADVCQLQDTEFTKGLEEEVEAFLLSHCNANQVYDGTAWGDRDVERYIEERWCNKDMAYARELLYGQLVTSLLGCLQYSNFRFYFGNQVASPCLDDDTVFFLCSIKKGYKSRFGSTTTVTDYIIPPRYVRQEGDQLTVEQLPRYFNGRHPRMLGEICMLADFVPSDYCELDLHADADLLFLSEVEQLGFQTRPFEPSVVEFIMKIVRAAKGLEVLVLKDSYLPNESIHLDKFCTELSCCSTFWSTFQILKILSQSWDDAESSEYTVSRDSFDNLIKAYFSAPTDHSQLVEFTNTKIEGDSTDRSPMIDQTYHKFKTVRLVNCRFVSSSKATPEAIANWLGREIKVLNSKTDSCSFQLKDANFLGQKRKHSELYLTNSSD